MDNKKLLIIALVLTFVAATAAITPSEVESLTDKYNSQIDEAPGFLKSLVGSQKINLHIDSSVNGTAENMTFGLETSDAVLSSVDEGGFQNPTLEVWIDDKDVQEVSASDNPLNTTSRLLEEGKIRYKSHGILNSIKMSLASLLF